MDFRPGHVVNGLSSWFNALMDRAFERGQKGVMNRLNRELAREELDGTEAIITRAASLVDKATQLKESEDPVKARLAELAISQTEQAVRRYADFQQGNTAFDALYAKEVVDHPTTATSSTGSTRSPEPLNGSQQGSPALEGDSSKPSETTIPQPKKRRRGRPSNVERELRRQAEEAETNGQASSEPGDR